MRGLSMRSLTQANDPSVDRPLRLDLNDSTTIWEHVSDEEDESAVKTTVRTPGLLRRESRRERQRR